METDLDDLARAARALGDNADIRAILHQVCELTGMGFAAVARVTEHRWIVCQVLDTIDFGLEPGEELDLKTTICDEMRGTGEAVVIDHVSAEPAWRTHHTPVLYGFESYISIPVVLADGSFFGTLCAIDPKPHNLNAGTLVATMRDFAAQVATIIDARALRVVPGSTDRAARPDGQGPAPARP